MKALTPLAAAVVFAFGLAAPAQAERDAFEDELTRGSGNYVKVDHRKHDGRDRDYEKSDRAYDDDDYYRQRKHDYRQRKHERHRKHARRKAHYGYGYGYGNGYGYGYRRPYAYAPYRYGRHYRHDRYYGPGYRHRPYGRYGHRRHYGGSYFALDLVLPLRGGYGGQNGYVAYDPPRRLSAETVVRRLERRHGLYISAVKYQAGVYYVWGQEPSGRPVKLHVAPVGGVIVAKYYLD